jgi:hypothetical protein
MWKEGKLKIGQNISNETQYGLRVDVTITQTAEDKPLIYTYIYKLNTIAFKRWLEEHAYLCEGPLAFTMRGIQVMVVGGAKKWDKSAFSLSIAKGDKLFLPLLSQEVRFTIHRDLFSGQEWDIYLDITDLMELEESDISTLLQDG